MQGGRKNATKNLSLLFVVYMSQAMSETPGIKGNASAISETPGITGSAQAISAKQMFLPLFFS